MPLPIRWLHELCSEVYHALHDVCNQMRDTIVVNQRDEQKERSRRAIAEAALRLVDEHPLMDFSMQEVATAAGVSLRTVYNHFASREELLDGAQELLDQIFRDRAGVTIGEVDHVDQLSDAVVPNFRIFEDLAEFSYVRDRLDRPDDDPSAAAHDHRTERIVELVGADLPDAPEHVARLVGVMVRHTLSHRSWRALTADYGLTTDDATTAVRWALEALLAAARRGDVERLEDAT